MKLSDEDDTSETAGGVGTSDDVSQGETGGEEGGMGGTSAAATATDEIDPNKPQWPSMVDLNQRLRRVINSYQRNFKKEELKLAQKAKVRILILFWF
jgi:chromodomain-helicase-DNA-binding protein 7